IDTVAVGLVSHGHLPGGKISFRKRVSRTARCEQQNRHAADQQHEQYRSSKSKWLHWFEIRWSASHLKSSGLLNAAFSETCPVFSSSVYLAFPFPAFLNAFAICLELSTATIGSFAP